MRPLARLARRALVATVALPLLATPALASPTLQDTFIGYPDHGYGDVIGDPADFDVLSASSSFDGRIMTVSIVTNYSKPIDGTTFGDLLLNPTWTVGARCTDAACDNPGTTYQRGDWSYAVHLANSATPTAGAGLYALPTTGADPIVLSHVDMAGNWIWRDGQPVSIDPTKATLLGAASTAFTPGKPGVLSFSFVAPTSFLTVSNGTITGYSFAMSWAPTCANDMIQGVLSQTGLNFAVPEPTTLLVVLPGLLALAAAAVRRARRPAPIPS